MSCKLALCFPRAPPRAALTSLVTRHDPLMRLNTGRLALGSGLRAAQATRWEGQRPYDCKARSLRRPAQTELLSPHTRCTAITASVTDQRARGGANRTLRKTSGTSFPRAAGGGDVSTRRLRRQVSGALRAPLHILLRAPPRAWSRGTCGTEFLRSSLPPLSGLGP